MTNGEKIQTILDIDRDCTEVHGERGTMTFTVTQDFWNAEYKEPTTKNNLGVDKEQLKTMIRGLTKWYVKRDNTEVGEPNTAVGLLYDDVMFGIDRLPQVIPQEPNKSEIPTSSTTKNDLGVDCISRADAIHAVSEALKRTFVEYEDIANKVIGKLPSVTPQPKTGHWIEEFNDLEGEVRFTCSSCGKYQLFGTDFCYNCGSDNREVEE